MNKLNLSENSLASAQAWANIYSSTEVRRDAYPDHNFIRALYYMNKNDWESGKGKKVLDIGFGKAYHLAYLGQIGYELHGTEVSQDAINTGTKNLMSMGLKADLKLVGKTLDYPDNYFDLIVCWGTLHFLGSRTDVINLFKEVKRTLKKDCYFLGSMIRPDNSQILYSKVVAPNVYEIQDTWPFDNRKGSRIFCIPDIHDVKNFIGEYFSNVQVGSFGSDIPNGWANWHYCFNCKKNN